MPGSGEKTYRTGYCKPPTMWRFKPGQSGNSKGRPKGSKNLKTLLADELNAKVTIREGERTRKVTKSEAMVKKLVADTLKGDKKALTMGLNDVKENLERVLGADDEAIIAEFVGKKSVDTPAASAPIVTTGSTSTPAPAASVTAPSPVSTAKTPAPAETGAQKEKTFEDWLK